MPKKIGITTTTTAAIASALLLMAPILASAASPHFIGTPSYTKSSSGALTVKFKAAGLANLPTGAFLTASEVTAELQCVNPGGNNPPPKTAIFGPETGPTTNLPVRNGQITGSATLSPPSQQQLQNAADCPNPNWTVKLVSITYSDVTLHIQQSGQDILTYNFGDIDP
ncbi:MAG: hypothetical protein M3247_02185 [Thermoproteota archaeon]|nr:hypothetical protein [Thermoproteota archaeon]